MIDHVHALPEGYRLQEYTITGTLGFGGFGITYSALDTHLDKVVAIKEYLPSELAVRVGGSTVSAKSEQDRDSFDWGLQRFLDEAKTLAKFDHPNVVRISRFFEQNGTGYIVMEFIQGRTLSAVLKEKGTLEESEIRAWLWPVMDGLKLVHKAGYLHRDIKPQNIMMRDDGRPCVLDFGAARMAVGGVTRSLTAIMTPGFAPLEQYETRGNQGPWTDIYALGAVMYGCIAGRKPKDALDRIRNDALETPHSDSNKTYSHGLLRGINAALSMQERDRPQSIDELLGLLDAPEAPTSIVAEPANTSAPGAESRNMPKATDSAPAGSKPGPAGYFHAEVESRQPKTNESSGIGKWSAIALSAFLAMALVLYWWLGSQEKSPDDQAANNPSHQEPEPTAQKPPSKLAADLQYEGINIRSDPPGASIFIDNEFEGFTPLSIKSLEPGRTATVRFQLEGYETDEQVVTAPTTGSGDVSMTLKKVIQKYALSIETEPADATVRILNIESDYKRGMLLEPGIYQAEVSKDGFATQNVSIEIEDRDNSPVVSLISLQSASGQLLLGIKYYQGDGVERDYLAAAKYFRMAAENGDASSQYWLGIMYRNGEGVERDYAEALQWFTKAAAQGDSFSPYWLGLMYFNGEGVERDYAKAFQWYTKAADQGDTFSQYWIGTMYANGQGVEQDYARALQWYTRAADQGSADAHNLLGVMYFNGQGVEQDYAKALQWFIKAADLGSPWAQFNLGNIYHSGQGVEQDYAKAFQWYTQAADLGNAEAHNGLGNMYFNGQGVEQDFATAFRWYTQAADKGSLWGPYNLGDMYRHGKGVEVDLEKAISWYRKAAGLGNEEAKKALADLGVNL